MQNIDEILILAGPSWCCIESCEDGLPEVGMGI
jgi:hypothetical protein